MGAIEEHAGHKVRTEGCIICAARKNWATAENQRAEAGLPASIAARRALKDEVLTIRERELVTVIPPTGPLCSECGAGPFKNLRALSAHGQKHRKAKVIEVETAAIVVPTEAGVEALVETAETEPIETVSITGIRADDLTREAWLLQAVAAMRPDFTAVGREVPEVRISIGWPGGRTARLDPLGQCWHGMTVGDGIPAIFITPSQDDPVQVLATTRHEMVHAAGEMNHRAGFRKLAAQVGFDPQPGASGVSSTYRTPALQAKLEALYAELGPFPHSPVNKGVSNAGKPATQTTRMLKVTCEEPDTDHDGEGLCGYTVRTTAKWLAVAIPNCPVHDVEMFVEVKS